MLPQTPFTLTHSLLLVTVLVVAAVLDAKNLKVSNKVWLIASPLALSGFIINSHQGAAPFLVIAWGLGFMITAFAFWSLGFMGGADAKAIIILGWALPIWNIQDNWLPSLLIILILAVAISSMIHWIRPQPHPFFLILSPITIGILWLKAW